MAGILRISDDVEKQGCTMEAHILLAGRDCRHRLKSLRSAGYLVDECVNIPELISWFRSGHDSDVVCVSEDPECASEGMVAVAKTFSRGPLVLFRAKYHHYIR